MKINLKTKTYDEVVSMTPMAHKKPKRTNMFFRTLLKVVSIPGLLGVNFSYNKIGMEKLGKNAPAFILMNHSSFIDLEIAASMLYPRPFNIIATTDGFVGKDWLMRQIGCIPTKKFVFDLTLIKDIKYAIEKQKSSVLMFPEAGYSLDGTATTLPDSLGKFVKMLGVPLVMIRTHGAFTRQPLYNNLNKRKVKVTADMTYLLSPEEIKELDVQEINRIIGEQFSFDYFKWQKENGIKTPEKDRADSLNRVLYKCPECSAEGEMEGKGITLKCKKCGKEYVMDELGCMKAVSGETKFEHIPEWFAWERECVRQELIDGTYKLDIPVDICMEIDTKGIYRIGEGRLLHDKNGIRVTGCDGKLDYLHTPISSYSICADFNWYEIGDVICVGNSKALYYCFPKTDKDVVAKARLAAEELYKLVREERERAALEKKRKLEN